MTFKWRLPRRALQFSAAALIAAPALGLGFFRGNLAAAEFLGVPLADPLAFLQALIGGRVLVLSYLGSALLVSAGYFLLGGRSFCGWICPVGLITEQGDKLSRILGRAGKGGIPLASSRWSLLLVLLTVALTGVPLFEVLSPIGIVNRAIVFASLLPLLLPAAILLVEVLVSRRVWCRSLCPLGGFYSLLARFSPLRVGFVEERCTHCGDCLEVCPVHEVLAPSLKQGAPQVTAGDCNRCLACIDSCSTKALKMDFSYKRSCTR